MASSKLILLVAFVACVLGGFQCQQVAGPNAIDMVTKPKGTHMVFPFFSQEVKQINPMLKEYFDEDIGQVLDLLDSVIGDSLRKHSGLGVKATYKLSGLVGMGKKQESRRRPHYAGVTIRKEFNARMLTMFNQLMEMSNAKYQTVKTGPQNYEKLADDLNEYVNNLKQAVKSSPVGIYIDFEAGQIGDSSFMEVTSEIMSRLQHHGYGSVFWGINKLLSLIQTFSG